MRRAKPAGENERVTPPANSSHPRASRIAPDEGILRSMKDLKEGIEALFGEAQTKGDRHLDPEISMAEGMRVNRVGDRKPNPKNIGSYSSAQPPKGK